MSAYTERETVFSDPETLVEALKLCGLASGRELEVHVHSIAQQLEGYHGDLRAQVAEIIIPRRAVGNASNDIGFKKQPDGTYRAIISQFDSASYNAEWLKKLKNSYTEAGILAKAKKAGLKVVGKKIVNGKMRLQFLQG
jgi:hypothetical protein